MKRLFAACGGARCPATFFQAERGPRCAFSLACLLAGWSMVAFAQNQPAPRPVGPLLMNQSRYRLHAGDRVPIADSQETLDFLRAAKIRTVTIHGPQGKGFVVAPNVKGDQLLLAASLTMKPGEYSVTVSAVSGSAEERAATVDVTLDPMQTVPNGSTVPPVVLLNGWQFGYSSTSGLSSCPISSGPSDIFGSSFQTQLMTSQSVAVFNLSSGVVIDGAGVPVVYFFDNCVEDPNGPIEDLGDVLGDVLNLIQYDKGTLVPQVDLVSHSMGGLIVRAYLSGLQTNGTLSPPPNPRVRKFVEIATPNFGSFLAANNSLLLAGGTQALEMFPGSAFLWSLASWNQRGDDLRGVDALAIIGDAGYWQASDFSSRSPNLSDGVVSITSASLGFASLSSARSPLRTRVLPYCHIDSATPIAGALIDCTGAGIADVDEVPDTGAIILSFLENNSAWQSIGNTNQTVSGGLYFALENATGTQYTALEGVSLGSQSFQAGGSADVYYAEFVDVAGTLEATSTAAQVTTCGSFSAPGGYYTAVRCKFSPSISGVQSNLSTGLPGLTVASGSTLTISGTGFAAGTSVFVNGGALSAQIVSSQEITASLPSTYSGLVGLTVSNSTGADEINIFVARPAQPPVISLSSTQLRFSYTVGGMAPATQTITVTNSGGGTLTWSAISGASWLTVSPATGTGSGTLTLGINAAGLSAQTYSGAVTFTAAAAINSPQTISVSLTVSAAPPSISLSASKASFAYTLGGSAPASQTVNISNTGGGTLAWSVSSNSPWLAVSPASGTGAGTLTLGINTAGLSVQTYGGTVTVTASGTTNSPQTISVTLAVSAAVPSVVVSAFVNAASWTGSTVAPGELIVIGGTMLGPSTGVSGTVDPSTGRMVTQLAGTTVLFDGVAAPLLYVSATQVNAIVPYEEEGCTHARLQVQFQGVQSPSMTLPCATAAPGIFTFNASGTGTAAAANQNGTFNGPSAPAAAGSYVTMYFTGGGQTNPPGVTGSITGTSTLKWLTQKTTVTVGGVAATVSFDGAAPTFVDGVLQLNIQLSPNTPSGNALPVVVTVGNVSSPTTATLAVQ